MKTSLGAVAISRVPLLSMAAVLASSCLSTPPQYQEPPAGAAAATGGGGGSSRGPDGPQTPSPEPGTPGTGGQGGSPGGFQCEPEAPCPVPGKPCLVGSTACSAGGATCLETTKLQANGTACGVDSACLDGVCAACKNGVDCPLADRPCKTGVIECGTGRPECTENGNAPNGTSCGSGQVCKDGACTACLAGDSCNPANPCHEGTLDCTGGNVTCKDSGRTKTAGTQCGSNKVCSPSGECVACVAGADCELPGEACKAGKIECGSGAPQCLAAGNQSNGKACGNGRVCRDGSCETCSDGTNCTPSNKCHVGRLSCSSGSPVCMDMGTNAVNGTLCGTNQFCSNGECNPCTANASCSPGDLCKIGRTSCETGTSQCRESDNAQNGKDCGGGRVCRDGNCVALADRNDPCNQGADCKSGTCVGGHCCNGGEKYCDGQCRAGSYCCNGTPCSITNGRGSCMGGSCQFEGCNDGFEREGSQCVRACGARDGQCPPGCSFSQDDDCKRPNGEFCVNDNECVNRNCTRNMCCSQDRNNCGGQCVGNSLNFCGPSCAVCPEPAGSMASCDNGVCRFSCRQGFFRVGETCVPCGGDGDRCCPGNSCRGNDLACYVGGSHPPDIQGKCGRCGFRDEPCCSGNTCKENNRCADSGVGNLVCG